MPNPRGSDPFDPNRLVQKTCLSDNHHQNTQYSSPGLLLSHNLHFSLVFRAIAEEWTFQRSRNGGSGTEHQAVYSFNTEIKIKTYIIFVQFYYFQSIIIAFSQMPSVLLPFSIFSAIFEMIQPKLFCRWVKHDTFF